MAGANGTRSNGGRPAWQRLTKAQREAFLELVREGDDRPTAARKVKAPARAFRALCRFDPRFDGDYEQARSVGRESTIDALREELHRRIVVDKTASDRLFTYTLATYDPDWAWLKRQRVEVTGKDGGPLEHKLFDPTKLSDEQLDEFEALLKLASVGE